jgi:hypothetical protein
LKLSLPFRVCDCIYAYDRIYDFNIFSWTINHADALVSPQLSAPATGGGAIAGPRKQAYDIEVCIFRINMVQVLTPFFSVKEFILFEHNCRLEFKDALQNASVIMAQAVASLIKDILQRSYSPTGQGGSGTEDSLTDAALASMARASAMTRSMAIVKSEV